jgi:hypothetical protein
MTFVQRFVMGSGPWGSLKALFVPREREPFRLWCPLDTRAGHGD